MASPIVRASVATIISLIIIPWLITDPHWRNVLLGFVGLYVLHAMTEQDKMFTPGRKAILITGEWSSFSVTGLGKVCNTIDYSFQKLGFATAQADTMDFYVSPMGL